MVKVCMNMRPKKEYEEEDLTWNTEISVSFLISFHMMRNMSRVTELGHFSPVGETKSTAISCFCLMLL